MRNWAEKTDFEHLLFANKGGDWHDSVDLGLVSLNIKEKGFDNFTGIDIYAVHSGANYSLALTINANRIALRKFLNIF